MAAGVRSQYRTDIRFDPVKAEVNMDQFHDPYAFHILYDEAPKPDGDVAYEKFLRARKLEAQRMTPVKEGPLFRTRGLIPPPLILSSFSGNNIITGTPLDNHLAIGNAEQPISTINTHMLVTNNTGFWLGSYKLDEFFAAVGTNTRFFDPRVIYDPEQDRFILVLINASECAESQIVLAFSKSNNPKGSWNLYALDGCIDDDGTFADYPMIAITKTELFLTYNEVHSDSSWQTGFMGTQIHQINKLSGFNGETLTRKVWRDIRYNGRFLRNICPVRNADESLPEDMYFLSNRNFDLTNDTVFVLHLTGQALDTNATLDISYRVMDQAYGAPPYAAQTRDSMDTNDARVLDAFRLGDEIQYVHNTMDFSTGRSSVYHGTISTNAFAGTGSGHIVGHPTDYLGYPGIAWTGHDPSEHDAIIVVSHCSPVHHPGGSAVYSDGLGQYSDFVTIIQGTKPVDMLTGPIERWGDYIGIQRFYPQPGSVWISCSYGRQGNVNEAWIAKLARDEQMVATQDPAMHAVSLQTYPNPTEDYVTIEVDNPEGKRLSVSLCDASGTPVHPLFDALPPYAGKASLHFSMKPLPPGIYIVRVSVGGEQLLSRRVVRQ